MQKLKILFWITIGLIIILPGISVKALSLGGVNVNVVTSGDGLYTDSYENGRYVYKGTNPNNYIDLGGDMWRIVAIESNGTIKLVKDNFITEMAFDKAGTRTSGYCAQGDAIAEGCNAWSATSTFSNGSFSGEVSSASQLNAYLNGTYHNSLNATVKNYIMTYDWGIGAIASETPTLEEEINNENSIKWTGYVALISHSDYMRSNSNTSCNIDKNSYDNYQVCRTTNWLYETGKFYWTLSPYAYYTEDLWVICGAGTISSYSANNVYNVRPAIHITPEIELTGTGTEKDPYRVKNQIENPTPEVTDENTPAEVVNVPATAKSNPYVILLTGFALIVIAIVTILIVTKVKKQKIINKG